MGELTISLLLQIQNAISLFVGVILLCMALYFTVNRNQKFIVRDGITLLTILFLATYGLGVLFEIDSLYLPFDRWTGMANLSWIIGWGLVNLSNYIVLHAFYKVQSEPIPKWIHYWFAFTLTVLIGIYWSELRNSEIRYPRIFARTEWELLYFGVSTTFCFGLCFQTALLHNRLYKSSSDLIHKIRYFLVQAICFPGSFYYLGRFYLAKLSLYNEQETVVAFFAFCIVVQVFVGVILSLPFLPPKTLLFIARPIIRIERTRQLRNLNRLRHYLLQAVHSKDATQNADLDNFHMLLIAILDCKVLLRRSPCEYKDAKLIAALEAVDDTADFDLLIHSYASVGAKVVQ